MIAPFIWWIPEKGYVWVEGLKNEKGDPFGPFLAPKKHQILREYEPGQDAPGLFRTFAATCRNRAAIRDFANRYGTLGVTVDVFGDRSAEPPEPGEEEAPTWEAHRLWHHDLAVEYRYADTLRIWDREILAMAKAIKLLDKITARIANPADARLASDMCNLALARVGIETRVLPTRKTNRLAIHHMPRSLLGVMWCQYALALVGAEETRQCPGCDQWFVVSATRGRKNQAYCKEACRARAYRRRIEAAVQFAGKGLTPREIARRIGTTERQVKVWLQRKSN